MKIQPFRIIEFKGEIKPGVDIPQVFEFLILGSKGILKPPYKITVHINEFTGKVVYTKCNCIDFDIKTNENCKNFVSKDYKCKHIKESERILVEFKHLTQNIKITSKGCGKHFVEPFDYTCGVAEVNGTPLCPDCSEVVQEKKQ